MHLTRMTMAVAVLGFGIAAPAADASEAEPKTWYVYCEGTGKGAHWAVFSENFWPHPMTDGYGHRIGDAARSYFETHHEMSLEGCSGVNFVDPALARHSRDRTVQLHKKMGDSVYFFPLPTEKLDVAEPQVALGRTAEAPPVDAPETAPAAAAVPRETPPEPAWEPRHSQR